MSIGFTVMFAGDLAVQSSIEQKISWPRVFLASTWNGFVTSPIFFVWFRYLDARFPIQVMKKTAINQLVMPLPLASGFLMYSTLTEGFFAGKPVNESLEEGKRRIRLDVPTIVATSSLFWFPMNYINFALVPAKYRLLPSIGAGLVWSAFLTFMGHHKIVE
jgi:protein Mpv17